MADITEHIESRDPLLLHQLNCMGLFLFKQRSQHVADGDFLLTRRMEVQYRPLQNPLQADGLFRDDLLTRGHALELGIKKILQQGL